MTPNDTLDRILQADGPDVSASSLELDAAIRAMARSTQRQVRPRRRGRPLVAGLAAALLLGGGVTVAAAATWQWHPWAEKPDASFAVTMPSGTVCEYRVGNVKGASAETNEEVRAFISEHDIAAIADIDGAIAAARADGQTMYDENGDLQPAGPGSELYNADFEYQSALNLAVSELVTDHLRSQGLLSAYVLDMQADCGGE